MAMFGAGNGAPSAFSTVGMNPQTMAMLLALGGMPQAPGPMSLMNGLHMGQNAQGVGQSPMFPAAIQNHMNLQGFPANYPPGVQPPAQGGASGAMASPQGLAALAHLGSLIGPLGGQSFTSSPGTISPLSSVNPNVNPQMLASILGQGAPGL